MTRVATKYADKAHAASIDAATLFEFVPKITPTFHAPFHLRPIASAIERAMAAARGEGDPVFLCSSIPPQHGKTETYLHGLAYWLHEQPDNFLAYLSYNSDQAEAKSSKVRDYARLADVDIRTDTHSKKLWRTVPGGGLMASGVIGGSVTGKEALQCLVVDDPFSRRADAESRVIRDKTWAEFRSSIWTRLHEGTSVFVNHTRWHPDDLIGRIKKDPELAALFEFLNFPAVTGCDPRDGDDYEVLCPEIQSKELIKRKRAGASDYEWYSLYMGEPRPRDSQLFQGVHFYDVLPTSYRVAIGVDLAYTSKTSSDWSVAVVMAEFSGRYFILDVVRRQCAATDFVGDLKRLQERYAGAPMHGYLAGTERGVADFFAREGVRLHVDHPTADKFIRAQPLSAAWNAGQVALPSTSPAWVEPFTGCLLDFTGLNDPHDDDVDAAAAAFDALANPGNVSIHRPRNIPKRTAPRTKRGRVAI